MTGIGWMRVDGTCCIRQEIKILQNEDDRNPFAFDAHQTYIFCVIFYVQLG
jgi:hypothetical protein